MTLPRDELAYFSNQINLYCLAEVLEPHGLVCGCPTCCAKKGLTAVYLEEDYRPGVRPLGYWGKVICREKLALLVKERIVPGWPGSVGRVTLDEEEKCTGWTDPTGPAN